MRLHAMWSMPARAIAAQQSSAHHFSLITTATASHNAPHIHATRKKYDSLKGTLAIFEREQRTDTALVRLLCQLAEEAESNEPVRSLHYAEKALRAAEQLNDTRGKALALQRKALALRSSGIYPNALECYLQMMNIADELHDNTLRLIATFGIGLSYYDQRYIPRAFEYVRRAQVLSHELGDTLQADIWNAFAVLYREEQKYGSALMYLERALPRARANFNNNPGGLYAALHNIASVYERQKDYRAAREYYRQMLDTVTVHQAIGSMLYAYRGLGRVELAEKHYAEALRYAMRAIHLADSTGTRLGKEVSYKLIADIYLAQGDTGRGFVWYQRFTELKDSLIGTEASRRTSALLGAYLFDKAIAERKAGEREQALFRNAAIIFGALLLSVLALVVNRYRIKSRSEKLLRETNAEISKQQEILSEQSRQIEEMNGALQEHNMRLADANVELDAANHEMQAYIEELSRVNSELDAQNEVLHSLNNEKDEFLGIVAHDLKNPLATIRLAAGILQRFSVRMTDEEKASRLQGITITVDRMMDIINNLLRENALEAGRVEIAPVPIPVAPTLETLVAEYQERAEAKSIRVEAALPRETLAVYADPIMLYTVLENLLSNAFKFSPPSTTVRIYAEASSDEQRGRIVVCDEGPGISEEDMKKLFGKFARLSARPTAGEHSTGLGLSIVKKMVEAMHGHVWCESKLGAGASFIVELPLAV